MYVYIYIYICFIYGLLWISSNEFLSMLSDRAFAGPCWRLSFATCIDFILLHQMWSARRQNCIFKPTLLISVLSWDSLGKVGQGGVETVKEINWH